MRRLAILMVLGGCGVSEPEVPGVVFQMFHGASYDMQPFNDAWNAARIDPAAGVAYAFPLLTTGLAAGTELRLLAGRSGHDPLSPSTTGDDVIIADERWIATTHLAGDEAEFAPLTVTTTTWASDQGAVPSELLCGNTVIAVRAFEKGKLADRLLAATWMVAATAPCE
jgi:hypothetical protein